MRPGFRIASIVLLVVLWKIITLTSWTTSIALPPPENVLLALLDQYQSGTLITDIIDSLLRVLAGFSIGSAVGLALGVAFALHKTTDMLLTPIVDLLRPVPPLAWVPMSIIWFGLGDRSAIFLVSIGAFFPMLTAGYSAIRAQDPRFIEHAKLLGLSPFERIVFVTTPQALPEIFSGLRTALGFSWMIVVAAELVGAQSGLGYMIQINRTILKTDAVLGGMLVIGLVGLSLTAVMSYVERLLVPWKFARHDNR